MLEKRKKTKTKSVGENNKKFK